MARLLEIVTRPVIEAFLRVAPGSGFYGRFKSRYVKIRRVG